MVGNSPRNCYIFSRFSAAGLLLSNVFFKKNFMPSRKLLEVVQLLTPEESKRATVFLKSPFFNQKSNAAQLVELYQLIVRHGADEQNPQLQKAAVSKIFFPEKPFRENEKNPIDSLASDLFGLLRRFLMFLDSENELDDDREMLALARFYLNNNLEERFEQTVSALRKSLESQMIRGAEFFKKRFDLEALVAEYQSYFNTFEDDANLHSAQADLDMAFAIQKLELSSALHFQRTVSQFENAQESDVLLVKLLENPHLPPVAKLYAHVIQMLNAADPTESLEEFGKMLEENRTQIPVEKLRDLQSFYRFFAGRTYVKQGGPDLVQRLFDLYEKHLEAGYFIRKGKMHTTSLRLLVNMALKLNRAEWVKQFLKDYPPARITGTRFPDETHSICLAEVYFHEKNYAAALDCLNYRMFENVNYRLVADVLLVKIYFSTGDELVESRLKALDQKVRRSKISAEIKLPYQNFLKIMEKIMRAGGQFDAKKAAKLVAEIRAMPPILEREWLISVVGSQKT